MPSASPELQDRIEARFGSIDTHGPEKFLKEAGYTLSRRWEWSKPGITSLGQMSRDEFECLMFLMHEWDYAGLLPAPPAVAKE